MDVNVPNQDAARKSGMSGPGLDTRHFGPQSLAEKELSDFSPL